jgi:hypothetical protein
LTGVIPPEIGLLANLMLVELNGNLLVGNIPPAFGSLTNLNHVFLEGNNLTGQSHLSLVVWNTWWK